jgi:hypothetical protein
VALPSYPEIRLALATSRHIDAIVGTRTVDAVHIATEGPIGLATRRLCRRLGLVFTTSYHTHFPDYLSARTPIPQSFVLRLA